MHHRHTLTTAALLLGLATFATPASAEPIFDDHFESPPSEALACDLDLQRVQPPGFTEHLRTWEKIFYDASFPNGPSHLAPVGSFSLRFLDFDNKGPTLGGRYFAIPFVPAANKNYVVKWLEVQPVYAANYYNSRIANSVFVSVSPCKGDLRARSLMSGDPELSHCRAQLSNGALYFSTVANSQCPLIAGDTYYLNIAFVDTTVPGPLSTTSTTCKEGERCEVNFRFF